MSQASPENLNQVEATDNSNSESSGGISTHEGGGKAIGSSAPFVIEPQKRRVITDFRELADGTLVELVRLLDEQTVERIANDFQPRLLMFRLRNYQEFSSDLGDISAFNPRMRDLLQALLSPLRGFTDRLNFNEV